MKARATCCQYATRLGDVAHNVELSLQWLDRAGAEKPDLVVLPELITTGYAAGDRMLELAEDVPGPTTRRWGEKARQYGFWLVAGICRRDPRLPGIIYNSAVLIDRAGELKGIYSKVVLPLYLNTWLDGVSEPIIIQEADLFRRGDALPVFETDFGRIGIQVCQDAVYPEFTRVQVLKGAQVIVQVLNGPAAPTQHEPDITPLTTRVHAFDNGVYIVLANKCGQETFSYKGSTMTVEFPGASHVADPAGNFTALAPAGEEALLVAEIDTDLVRQAQWATKFLRDWRPELLEPLCRRGVSLGWPED